MSILNVTSYVMVTFAHLNINLFFRVTYSYSVRPTNIICTIYVVLLGNNNTHETKTSRPLWSIMSH